MKKTIIILMIVVMCVYMLPLQVVAIAPEETTETIIEEVEATETDVSELTEIKNLLTMILFTNIFMILIHFSEKWLRIGFNLNKDSGRI